MISPLSITLALAMTYNGADGETKTAMEKTLKVYGLSPDDINDSYLKLLQALETLDSKVLMEIANAIYYRENFNVEPDFISTNNLYYDAAVSALDFNKQQQALDIINGWVNEKTHGKIESIIDEITPDHIMFLLNAIYFKGIWQKEFNKKSTETMPFYTSGGMKVDTEMMQRTDTLPYYSNSIFSTIRLDYGKGNYNMFVFLPHQNKKLTDIVNSLNYESWKSWIESFSVVQNVNIKIPKFKSEYEILLNDVLSDMGMGIAFTGGADFSGINPMADLRIDYVKHKSFIEVNEEGTEAAAVTVVAIERLSAEGSDKVHFVVNRPFLYAITEKSTGTVLFIGTVKNPSVN